LSPRHDPVKNMKRNKLLGGGPMRPGEVETDFGPHFHIEKLMEHHCGSGFVAGEAVYLMARHAAPA